MRFVPLVTVISLGFLAACSGGEVRDTLGLNSTAPDEFTVYSRPPLSVPPEFDLKPPRPGEAPRGVMNPRDQARETLLGAKPQPATLDELEQPSATVDTAVDPVLTTDAPSGAQASFLKKAGADAADEDIRGKLANDQPRVQEKLEEDQSPLERWFGGEQASEPVVDAKGEAERLRSNKDEGKPVTEGDTPTEDEKKGSVIDRLF